MSDREFVGGFLLQTLLPRSPMAFARNSKPGGWGWAYARDIEAYQNLADLWIVGEDLPQARNAMTFDPQVRDQDGLPVARIFHVDYTDDVAMLRRAWQVARTLYEAAGARSIHTRGPFSATHNMGTCRQSANPRDGVCDTYGQTHDVSNLFIPDGSQFAISAAENPTLTIVALAMRQADHIAGRMTRREL